MGTNININDELMREAMEKGGSATKKAVVEEALRLFIETRGQESILKLRGKVHWEGNLDESRLGRFLDRE